jgi:phosphotransferase system  glucose/maltose/N-acetylglucosamine-specific IIC component
MNEMKFLRFAVIGVGLILPLILFVPPSTVFAEEFVSFNGGFHFSYPETWMQIDYMTAEYYLTQGDLKKEVDFEAVFSVKETMVLFQGQYMILTVDTVGSLTSLQIDSVVTSTAAEFKRPVKEVSSEEFLVGSCRDSLLFDRANGLLAAETEVPGDKTGTRTNLLVMKFYERGIANFYFYAPSAEYPLGLPNYRQMVMSFSTENLEEALGRDSVKVADSDGKTNVTGRYFIMLIGLFVIALAILVARRKRTSK